MIRSLDISYWFLVNVGAIVLTMMLLLACSHGMGGLERMRTLYGLNTVVVGLLQVLVLKRMKLSTLIRCFVMASILFAHWITR